MNLDDIKNWEAKILEEAKNIKDSNTLEEWRIKYLGRRGKLVSFFEELKDLATEEKKKLGPALNQLKQKLQATYQELRANYTEEKSNLLFDYTQPGKKQNLGSLNLETLMEREILKFFSKLGFEVIEGPEVESEYYNFDALNIPKNHPARDMWDTFWLEDGLKLNNYSADYPYKATNLLLRTHTSPVQMRYMEKNNPPIKIIVPGVCYRYEATDARHDFQFRQIEGLMVDKKISLANFKYIMEALAKTIFGKEIKIRFLPSYFPFVSPGLQMDISCFKCQGRNKNCRLCGGSGWMEVLGAGMVHKNLYRYANWADYNYEGFAFGLGLERFTMIKYGIDDIRVFNSGIITKPVRKAVDIK